MANTVERQKVIDLSERQDWEFIQMSRLSNPADNYLAYVTTKDKRVGTYQTHLYNADSNGFSHGHYGFLQLETALSDMRSRL